MGGLFSSENAQESRPVPSKRYSASSTANTRTPLSSQYRSTQSPINLPFKADSIPKSSSKPQERSQTSTNSVNHDAWITTLKKPESVKTSLTEPKEPLKPSLSMPPEHFSVNPSPAVRYAQKPRVFVTDTTQSKSPTSAAPVKPAFKPPPLPASQPYSSPSKPQERPQTLTSSANSSNSVDTWITSFTNTASTKTSLTQPKESLKPSLSMPPEHFSVNPSSVNRTVISKPSGDKHNSNPSPAIKYVKESHLSLTDTSPSPSPSAPVQPAFKPPPLTRPYSPSSLPNTSKKKNYVWIQKSTTPLYMVPEDFKELIVKDIVPQVLRKSLTPMTYKNYFEALLYAEDVYCEKWSNYCLENVTLELHEAALYKKSSKKKNIEDGRDDKVFVAFHMDSIPERRPFLLSRDFVLLRPSGKAVVPFQGIIYRVVKSNLVLAEFGDDFYLQHFAERKYDVSFSFNRVCLKRCHQAIAAATDTLFHKFLFPEQKPRISGFDPPPVIPFQRNLNRKQLSTVNTILSLSGSPPFLIEGPLSINFGPKRENKLSETGLVIKEAVQQIYRNSPSCRILISAPTNSICDVMMRSLKEAIPESEILRANAAFRDLDDVPGDILPFCPVKGEIFSCPPLHELQKFKVVLSTFMSSFRLHSEGISASHFSHVFLVDASSTIEPETIVPLANLVDEKTVVVVSGAIGNCSGWVRSVIARECGLKISYFQRLVESEPYCSFDPMFVVYIKEAGQG